MAPINDRKDIYTRVTDTIIAQLEKGARPWAKPWGASAGQGQLSMPLRHNGVAYRGINVVMLWGEALTKGYTAPTWMTFKQTSELGASVRKGEKGSLVVYASKLTRTEADEVSGEEHEKDIPFLKGYTVFNVEQIDGLPEQYVPAALPPIDPPTRDANADAFFKATGAIVLHNGNRAYYRTTTDHIQMPKFETFRDAESYYATLAHECVHWTMPKHRLDRNFGHKKWGDEGYAIEELVAELGVAFICTARQITPEVREDHAGYIDHWLKVLKNDKRAIFTAASHAQRAADYLSERAEISSAP